MDVRYKTEYKFLNLNDLDESGKNEINTILKSKVASEFLTLPWDVSEIDVECNEAQEETQESLKEWYHYAEAAASMPAPQNVLMPAVASCSYPYMSHINEYMYTSNMCHDMNNFIPPHFSPNITYVPPSGNEAPEMISPMPQVVRVPNRRVRGRGKRSGDFINRNHNHSHNQNHNMGMNDMLTEYVQPDPSQFMNVVPVQPTFQLTDLNRNQQHPVASLPIFPFSMYPAPPMIPSYEPYVNGYKYTRQNAGQMISSSNGGNMYPMHEMRGAPKEKYFYQPHPPRAQNNRGRNATCQSDDDNNSATNCNSTQTNVVTTTTKVTVKNSQMDEEHTNGNMEDVKSVKKTTTNGKNLPVNVKIEQHTVFSTFNNDGSEKNFVNENKAELSRVNINSSIEVKQNGEEKEVKLDNPAEQTEKEAKLLSTNKKQVKFAEPVVGQKVEVTSKVPETREWTNVYPQATSKVPEQNKPNTSEVMPPMQKTQNTAAPPTTAGVKQNGEDKVKFNATPVYKKSESEPSGEVNFARLLMLKKKTKVPTPIAEQKAPDTREWTKIYPQLSSEVQEPVKPISEPVPPTTQNTTAAVSCTNSTANVVGDYKKSEVEDKEGKSSMKKKVKFVEPIVGQKYEVPQKNSQETVAPSTQASQNTPPPPPPTPAVSAAPQTQTKMSFASIIKMNQMKAQTANSTPVKPTATVTPLSVNSNPTANNGEMSDADKDNKMKSNGSVNVMVNNETPKSRSAQKTDNTPCENNSSHSINVNTAPAQTQNYCDDPLTYRMGEFLLSYQMDKQTVSLLPRGLTNRSNYCYINSILQALLACPPFYNLLMAMPHSKNTSKRNSISPLLDNMIKFVHEFMPLSDGARLSNRKDRSQKRNDNAPVDIQSGVPFEPVYVYTMLKNTSSVFSVEGRQEDAEEFLSCLLNGISDEMLELMKLASNDNKKTSDADNNINYIQGEEEWKVMGPKNKGSITRCTEFGRTPLSDIFRGQLRSRVSRSGEQSTDYVQPFFTLQLDIEKAESVKEAFQILVGKDQVEGMTCSKTKQQIEAWKQVFLEELPVILILHLKWFDYKLDGCSKILKQFEFPVNLKVDHKFLSTNAAKKFNLKQKQYKLFAVTYHDGKEATKGHYLTDAFHVGYGGWVRYDDNSLKGVPEESVLKPQSPRVPYLLYYRRVDTIGNNNTNNNNNNSNNNQANNVRSR